MNQKTQSEVDHDIAVQAKHEPPEESILIEAERTVNGPRRATYGSPLDDYERVAKGAK